MKFSTLFALPATLLSTVYAATETPHEHHQSTYNEYLHLKPLPQGSLYAGFSFTSTTLLSAYNNQHYRYFPRALAQILQYTHTRELHLRFSLGRWDEESWGSRPRSGLREGGNGVELWAWIENGGSSGAGQRSAEDRWSDLVNSLSGLFCASLNFIDSGKTVRPVLSFEPEGTLHAFQSAQANLTTTTPTNRAQQQQGELELLHGMLPHEVVCTENLTPFLKLLPCKGKAGISSLLDGHKLFDANWQTMSVDVRPNCPPDGGECVLEIQQVVDMVLDMQRSQRPRGDPIPRPLPIEEVVCDESKSYNGEDTCYPKQAEGESKWGLSSIFGRPIKGSCPLSRKGKFDIRLDVPSERTVEILTEDAAAKAQNTKFLASGGVDARFLRVPEGADFDLHLPRQVLDEGLMQGHNTFESVSIRATRHLTGSGQERGRMHTTLHNDSPHAQRVVYLESLPWFLRPYMHTLTLSGNGAKIEKMYYTPLLDRKRPTHLELLLYLPAHSTADLTYDVEKAILRYTEYPPDANRGFDVPAAVIRVLPPGHGSSEQGLGQGQGEYLRTTSLLLPLPTPDFSMPYNVIILTSTVVALGFGSIFNLLVRRFVLVEEVPVSVFGGFVRKVVGRVREFVAGLRKGKVEEGERADGDDGCGGAGLGLVNGGPKEKEGGKGRVGSKKDI